MQTLSWKSRIFFFWKNMQKYFHFVSSWIISKSGDGKINSCVKMTCRYKYSDTPDRKTFFIKHSLKWGYLVYAKIKFLSRSSGWHFKIFFPDNGFTHWILTFHAWYRLQWRQFPGKIKSLFLRRIWKNVSLCSLFLCTRHRDKLPREVIPYMKIVKKLIKSLLLWNILPNLEILSVYILLYNSVYALTYTNHCKLDNIIGFR